MTFSGGGWWRDVAARLGQRLRVDDYAAPFGGCSRARRPGGAPPPPRSPRLPARTGARARATAPRHAPRCYNGGGPALTVTCAAAVGGGALGLRTLRSRRRGGALRNGFWEDKSRRATDVLLVTNVAAYALQLLSRGALTSWGAKVNSRIAAGQLWRLVTPALLHGGVVHLLLNSYALNELGPSAEALLGRGRFVALYALSAVSGNVASYMCSPRSAVGASGAVFGLLGCLGVYLARHRHLHGELELKAVQRSLVLNLLFGAVSPNVDNWAHLGGLAGGALFAFVMGPNLQWEGRWLVDRGPLLRLPPRPRRH